MNLLDEYAIASLLNGIPVRQTVLLTVQGTAQPDPWGGGYPADLARALVTDRPDLFIWDGIDYPATAFPMKRSYTVAVTNLVARLSYWANLGYNVILIGYSQGAIATSIVLQRMQRGDLKAYMRFLLGGITFGNPMRQFLHSVPGGIDNGGQGIVTPTNVDTPANWWDFACDSAMVGAPGDDLYCKAGKGGTDLSLADERAVWNIVDTGNPLSLAMAIEQLLVKPSFKGAWGAVKAAFQALGFFVAQGIRPHTSYQFVQPVAGDPRDCWRMAYDHCMNLALLQQNQLV